jgi:uroporphyrinogen decarboxylase
MTEQDWNKLLDIINGKSTTNPPIGFIIDSPWIPGWHGVSTLEYYTSDKIWWEANIKAIETFPDVMFLPGFWSEYGMCTEPSAFGARMVWYDKNLPHAEKLINSTSEIDSLPQPNVKTDGLLPFMINRLKGFEPQMNEIGHQIKFAVARGPLNIATFLMGTTEFMMAMTMEPDKVHALLNKITKFICEWVQYQKECFPSIEGILLLDDIIGFVGDTEFDEFVTPYLKEAFSSIDVPVRFLHNDAFGLITAKHLEYMGVNLFNFSFEHSMSEIRELAGPSVTLLGNIPPRDVMALGSSEDIRNSVKEMISEITDRNNIIWSCGGGMPQDVSTQNMQTFINAVKEFI